MFIFNGFVLLMYSLITLSIAIGVTAESWFTVWGALELNTLAFLGLLSAEENPMPGACLKYFLVQSSSSFILLMSAAGVSTGWGSGLFEAGLLMAGLIKLGGAPVHHWLVDVMQDLTWGLNLVLMTLQKILPLTIMMVTASYWNWVPALVSGVVGGLGGWNQLNLRKVMAYSSIHHLGWLLACAEVSPKALMTYWAVYSLLTVSLVLAFHKSLLSHLTDLSQSGSWGPRMHVSLLLISLAGMPPLTGFMPKWTVLEASMSFGGGVVTLLLLMSSLIPLSFYLRLILSNTMVISSSDLPLTQWKGVGVMVGAGVFLGLGMSVYSSSLQMTLLS